MGNVPKLIVMLTWNDMTVENAYEVFEACKNTKAQYWGFKEAPLPPDEMKRLYAAMKACGKTTLLEVVAYDEPACLRGAQIAVDCGVDILMGTMYFDSINELCKANGIKYMPFVGEITGRPSVLSGDVNEMLATAGACLEKGVYGFDLLGYRYVGDAAKLNREFVAGAGAPVCLAGSVDSFARLDEVKAAAPWAFTIGSAFFENKFGGENKCTMAEQIDRVYDYMHQA